MSPSAKRVVFRQLGGENSQARPGSRIRAVRGRRRESRSARDRAARASTCVSRAVGAQLPVRLLHGQSTVRRPPDGQLTRAPAVLARPRRSFTPRASPTSASTATARPATSHGWRRRCSASQPIFVQSTTRPAAAPQDHDQDQREDCARAPARSRTPTATSTSAAVTKPERAPPACSRGQSSPVTILCLWTWTTTRPATTSSSSSSASASASTPPTSRNGSPLQPSSSGSWTTTSSTTKKPRISRRADRRRGDRGAAQQLGRYLVRHWERLSLVEGESLVYWLRKLVFRGAWLDHRVKDGRLEVTWDDGSSGLRVPRARAASEPSSSSPHSSWHELQFRRA